MGRLIYKRGTLYHMNGVKQNLTKLALQFLLNISGYKHARRLGRNSFEK